MGFNSGFKALNKAGFYFYHRSSLTDSESKVTSYSPGNISPNVKQWLRDDDY